MATEERLKGAVVCEDCDSIHVAWFWPDGTSKLVGTGERCPCGCREFARIT